MMNSVKIGWGLAKDGTYKHIRSVDNGLKCDCVCPDCQQPLIANQGNVKRWHFAHASNSSCKGESVIHRLAKQVIVNAVHSGLPLYISSNGGTVYESDKDGVVHSKSWYAPERQYQIQQAEAEVKLGSQIVDVLCHDRIGNALAVEIFYTHKKSDVDVEKFAKNSVEAIEIDVSGIPWDVTYEQIEQAVLLNARRRVLHSIQANKARASLVREIEERLSVDLVAFDAMIEMILNGGYESLDYPVLSHSVNHRDDRAVLHTGRSEQRPKLTSLDKDIVRLKTGLVRTTGVVSNKVEIDVFFSLSDFINMSKPTKPALLIVHDKGKPRLEWLCIEKWQDKVDELALVDLINKMPHIKLLPRFQKLKDKYK
ncbi:competence protein CoiA family protein [Vibrio parahaemolyticus]|uniref:competence protein CoiA family protein n=1 Tax=Vibrio parahaemolyticus TaxID=670 RepID=UPI0004481C69|nr:competence protein CoiA family protein [Vibrio parahaemolyticus]EVT81100.1 competence CoiA-like family protein [Vibrio parahaemolyticus V14/01]